MYPLLHYGAGRMKPRRTRGLHRLYSLSQFKAVGIKQVAAVRKTIAYARVSGRDQSTDLERQKKSFRDVLLFKKLAI